ncbi:MAG: type IV secretion system protein [Pseudomonadota bacterium]|nr:type IV secretion system protein [Pseudomonadota bacterium]
MFKRKAASTASTEKAIQRARDFEVSLSDLSKKSERRAWLVASASLLMSVLLAAGYIFVMPLKQQVPYLVLADPYRGTSTVAQLESLSPVYTANEFINKSNVANFLIARESFEWDISPRRDRRMVYSMATGPALAEYRALFSENNPANPVTVYGPNLSLRIKILSIILQGGGENRAPHTAVVRFERWVFNRASAQSKYLDTRIATMSIGYDKNLQMNEEGRYMNPLGFRVPAYRTDPDAFGAQTSANPPAPAGPASAAPALQAPVSTPVSMPAGAQETASWPADDEQGMPPPPVAPMQPGMVVPAAATDHNTPALPAPAPASRQP